MGCEGRRYSRDAGATSDGGNDPCRTNGRVHVAMVALRQALAKYLVRYHFGRKQHRDEEKKYSNSLRKERWKELNATESSKHSTA